MARAFDRWIDRSEDGRYILKNSVNWAYVEIEGPPFFVTQMQIRRADILVKISDGSDECLVPQTLRQGPDGRLYCDVRAGLFVAGFNQQATMQFEPLLDEDEQGLFVTIGGVKVRPPVASDPLSNAAH